VTKSNLTGVEFIIKHLKDSPNSARAILPLINYEEVVETTYDYRRRDYLPALNIVQFALDRNDAATLNITMYFRSLEVNHYLRINLCEAYLLAKAIAGQIQSVKSVNLTIHAFVAQYYEGNRLDNVLCRIDMMPSETLTVYLLMKQYALLAELFEDKRNSHNYADINAIMNMDKALNALKSEIEIPAAITTAFHEVKQKMEGYAAYRACRSILVDTKKRELEIERLMSNFIDVLREMENK